MIVLELDQNSAVAVLGCLLAALSIALGLALGS